MHPNENNYQTVLSEKVKRIYTDTISDQNALIAF